MTVIFKEGFCEKKITLKQLGEHCLLLIFILLFVNSFEHFFGYGSIFIASFSVTALLMFSSFSLQLPRRACYLLFPILFPLCVILPYGINQAHNVLFGSIIIILSVVFFLFFLGPSLSYQSYVPFLFLYALNLNAPLNNFTAMLFASFIGGIAVSIAYHFSHPKENFSIKELQHKLKDGFYSHLPFVIKVTLGMVAAYVIGFLIDDLKTSWIIVTVVSLTEVDLEYTKTKLWQRVVATLIGITFYSLFLIYVDQYFPQFIPFLLIFISYIYTFLNNYFIKMIFVTFNSLNAAIATLHLPTQQMISSRFIYIILGAIIAVIFAYLFHHLHEKFIQKKQNISNKIFLLK